VEEDATEWSPDSKWDSPTEHRLAQRALRFKDRIDELEHALKGIANNLVYPPQAWVIEEILYKALDLDLEQPLREELERTGLLDEEMRNEEVDI